MFFLNINKPKGISSFDVIRILRKKLSIKQIGHSGTLDPLASGVLQVGVDECTKLLDYLPSDKKYIADICFGYVTDTYDDEGEKRFIAKPSFTKDELLCALNSFLGKTSQVPPKYSAIKINGKKLCDLSRINSDFEFQIEPREIEIYSIELLEFSSYENVKILVHCKKGTYIRSLAYDIGEKLKCGAYITNLSRIEAGNFSIENSDDLDSDEFNKINPLDVLPFDKYELNEIEYNRVMNGNFICNNNLFKTDKVLLTKNNKLVSFANLSDNLIKPKKVFRGN